MSMNVGNASGEGEVMVEMNTTPLIDVMLVLLTLLIITLPIQTHAVKLDMPSGATTPPTITPETVELGVDFDGSITWNGQTIDRGTMDAYFEDAAKKTPQPEIHVNPNRLAKYDAVAKVLADAQRLGVIHIGFTGIDQYNS
jgi:biopolymer transport protein ExbD